MASKIEKPLQERLEGLYNLEEDVQQKIKDEEERKNEINNLIKQAKKRDKPLDIRIEALVNATYLIEENIETEKKAEEEIEEIEGRIQNIKEGTKKKIQKLLTKSKSERTEEQKIEKDTKKQIREIYKTAETIRSNNNRNLDDDTLDTLNNIIDFLQDQRKTNIG